VAPPRRGGARAATWTGGRRWFIALGTLALALLLPRLLAGQGLRSAPAAVTLQVTAPGRVGPEWRGASVVDVPLALPPQTWEVQRVELQLAEVASAPATLHARGPDGRFVPITTQWRAIGGAPGVSLRIVRADGRPLDAGVWAVRYRMVPRDSGQVVQEGATTVRLSVGR
jgi:hypothetical protein